MTTSTLRRMALAAVGAMALVPVLPAAMVQDNAELARLRGNK